MVSKFSAIPLLTVLTVGAAADGLSQESASMLDESSYRSLVAESKAYRAGDVLTVVIQEAASASSSADLRAQRSFAASVRADSATSSLHDASLGTDSQSDGAGRTERSGRLLAQVSVRVMSINENGDLAVNGQQSLRINGEEQLITLSGVVRTHDITDGNTVLSSRIADAHIVFDGKGFVARQSRAGWLARFFSYLGL